MAPEGDSSWRGLGSYPFVGATPVLCIVVGLAGGGRGGRHRAAEFPLARSQRGERRRSRAGWRLGRRGPSRRVASPPFHGWRPRPAPGERLGPPAPGGGGAL